MKNQVAVVPFNIRYYIYVFYRIGNVGDSSVIAIEEQPEDGFDTNFLAELHLADILKDKDCCYYGKFTILKTYSAPIKVSKK